MIARSGRPTSSLKIPYACVTFPCGQKSLHSGYFFPPRDSAHAFSVYTLSHERPTTWALPPAKRSCSAFSAGASLFQVLVNAKAKNASTTRCPRSFESVTSLPSCARSVKSGAASPTFNVLVAIFVRPFGAAIRPRLAAHGRDRFPSTHRGRSPCIPRVPGQLSILRRQGRSARGHAGAPRRATESALRRDREMSEVRRDLRGAVPQLGDNRHVKEDALVLHPRDGIDDRTQIDGVRARCHRRPHQEGEGPDRAGRNARLALEGDSIRRGPADAEAGPCLVIAIHAEPRLLAEEALRPGLGARVQEADR